MAVTGVTSVSNVTSSLNIPVIFSTLSKLEPSLHSTTLALATSTLLIICLMISPFLKLPVALTTTKIELDWKVDPTVLSK